MYFKEQESPKLEEVGVLEGFKQAVDLDPGDQSSHPM